MRNYFLSSGIILIIIAIDSSLSKYYGWYAEFWFTDVILHTISGVALGLFWLGIARHKVKSNFVLYLGLISFSVFASVIWEFWELMGWRIFPEFADHYTPSIEDTLSDLACGMTGGVVISLAHYFKSR